MAGRYLKSSDRNEMQIRRNEELSNQTVMIHSRYSFNDTLQQFYNISKHKSAVGHCSLSSIYYHFQYTYLYVSANKR